MIYIVDDDDSVRASLVRLMRSAGLPASAFPTAEDFLRDMPPADGAVAVIDVHLPGMSGLELQRELLRLGSNFPVVMMTAFEDSDVRRTALNAGALGLLIKPFGETALLELVERGLQGKPSGAEAK
jgi:FixJ family two-component response regulator